MAVLKERQTKNTGLQEKQVLSLSYGRIVIKPDDKLHGLVPASFETYQIVEPGNVIVRPTDLQNDQVSLRVGQAHHKGIITSAYLCLEARGDLTPDYAYLVLHAYDLMKVFYGMGSGLRQNLDWSDFRRVPIPVPPREEQEAIVRFINHLDHRVNRLIRAKRRLIELLDLQKQSCIDEIITGLEGSYPYTRLKYVASVQTGLTLGKQYQNQPVSAHPYLRVANVQAGRLDMRTVKSVEVPLQEALKCTLRSGDVLMTEGGDIDKLGRGCVWRDEVPGCLHQNHVFAVRCGNRLQPEYLVLMMGSRIGRDYFQTTAKQTTNLASTNSTTLGNFQFCLPPLEDQGRFVGLAASSAREIDAATDRVRSEIDLIREYRTRLVSDVVTGKLDVRHLDLPEIEDTLLANLAEDIEDASDEAEPEEVLV